MRRVRIRGQRLVYGIGGATAAILIVLGALLLAFIASAIQVNVNGQTQASAASVALAAQEDLAGDISLARTVSMEDGLARFVQDGAPETGQILTRVYSGLLSANPRVAAFYFFRSDASYLLGLTATPNARGATLVEQPPVWYGTDSRMQATLLEALQGRVSARPAIMLSFGEGTDPYGMLDIFQRVVSTDGRRTVGAVMEQVHGSSLFAPYIRAGRSGNMFAIGPILLYPEMASDARHDRLPVLRVDSTLDDSLTGGLRQTPVGFSLDGSHPTFVLRGTTMIASLVPVGATLNAAPLQAINYTAASPISSATRRALLLVIAVVSLLVLGVGALIVYLQRRLAREERDTARRMRAKNDALVEANRKLEVLATTDSLTNLPNRTLFHERLAHTLDDAAVAGHSLALLLLDLDRFKDVNDTLGHQYGDVLLQQVGARLNGALRQDDVVARLGGDEFALLLPTATAIEATEVARRFLGALESPFQVEGQALDVGGSVGIALYPEHGTNGATLLRCADVAMYAAKRSHAGICIYAADMDQHSPRRLALMGELRQAIAAGAVQLFYQPKVDLGTGAVRGVEALLRWHHPVYGPLSPDTFVPLAEHTGLIAPLTEWVLETALDQCRAWQRERTPLNVAVNLSMRTLHDASLPSMVGALLGSHDVAPERLTLEITESALMADPTRALDVVRRLSASGVRVAIDDFGTGYSSLSYFKQLPVHEIKLDKSFVLGLASHNDGMDLAIVRSVIAMSQALDREVVAEGVESTEIWKVLLALRCDMAQGHYLGQPMSADNLQHWIADPPWRTPNGRSQHG